MQALRRILAILEIVANSGEPATATMVAQHTDLSISTASRLMHQLVAEDVLRRSGSGGGYTLGPRVVAIARAGTNRFDLREQARPILEALRDVTGETVSLHVRSGDNRICVASAPSRHAVARVVPLGLSLPLVGSATGEVLLAGVPAAERDELITELPDAERAALLSRLQHAREMGWLIVSDAWVPGVTGLSCAVADSEGTTVATLSCSGPSTRFTEEVAREYTPHVLASAKEISDVNQLNL